MKISETLWEAAHRYLSTDYQWHYETTEFCCHAIAYAHVGYENLNFEERDEIKLHMNGCEANAYIRPFLDGHFALGDHMGTKDAEVKQQIRFTFLMFMYWMAKGEGK